MADNTSSDAPPGENTAVFTADNDGPMTLTEAANAVTKAREAPKPPKEDEPPDSPPAEEPPAEPDDTALLDEAPGDATEEAVPAVEELPPIEPPRSWSKEDKDLFATLPRETQERTAERERARERDFLRRQNEAAEKSKTLEAERQQTAQIRQQYENTLPNLLAAMQSQIAGEFADIRGWADVEKLQAEDPFRYQKYDLAMKKAQAVQQELAGIQQRQAATVAENWRKFAQDEDAKFAELAPEMSDPVKGREVREAADKMLKEIGYKSEELEAAYTRGQSGISLRDHRVQLVIRDAALWRMAQAKAKQVRQAPVPQVVKPGTARSTRGDDNAAKIASLQKQLQTANGRRAIELATELHQLKRAAS